MLPSFYFPGVYPKPINHFEVLTYSDLVLAHIILSLSTASSVRQNWSVKIRSCAGKSAAMRM